MKKAKVFWFGKLRPWGKVKFSPMNTGLFFGESLFESVPVYKGKGLFLRDHLERLKKGCHFLGWPFPPVQEFRKAIGLWAKEWEKEAGFMIRFNLTQELAMNAGPRTFSTRLPVVFATTRPLRHDPNSYLPPMGNVGISPWRAPHAGMAPNIFKVAAYLTIRDTFRKNPGWDEMLRLNDRGYVVDGGGSTPLWFDGRKICVPPLPLGGLESVTCKKIIQLCRMLRIPTVQKAWKPQEALQKGELFFVGSGVGLMRVSGLMGKKIQFTGSLGLRLWHYYRNLAVGKTS